jgi:hypothetical protein
LLMVLDWCVCLKVLLSSRFSHFSIIRKFSKICFDLHLDKFIFIFEIGSKLVKLLSEFLRVVLNLMELHCIIRIIILTFWNECLVICLIFINFLWLGLVRKLGHKKNEIYQI